MGVELTLSARASGSVDLCWWRWGVRSVVVVLTAMTMIWHSMLQLHLEALYDYLLSTWVFNTVYFETWWVTAVYPIVLFVPFAMDSIPYFNRYKIEPGLQWQSAGLRKIVWEVIEYITPLMILDTFMVKKYSGVEPSALSSRAEQWVQTTRALPTAAPQLYQVVYQLVGSFILYDVIFFALHYTCHRQPWLYRNLHKEHHSHDVIYSRVTNQMSVAERIALVLSANQALKFMHAHPLTRMIFVPAFLAWLADNHCGYDVPWGLDKVVPGGLIAGSRRHHEHHKHGARYYQPFFTYLDNWLLSHKAKIDE